MPIPFACPHCGHETLVEAKFAGETGPCIECDKPLTVPLAPTQGAVLPEQKIDLTGGSAAGVAITCGVVLCIVALLSFSGFGLLWFWWRLGW